MKFDIKSHDEFLMCTVSSNNGKNALKKFVKELCKYKMVEYEIVKYKTNLWALRTAYPINNTNFRAIHAFYTARPVKGDKYGKY